MNNTYATASITSDAAHALIAAANAASRDIGIRVTIAVTDAGGHLSALARNDGAPFLSINVAIDKAWTATSSSICCDRSGSRSARAAISNGCATARRCSSTRATT